MTQPYHPPAMPDLWVSPPSMALAVPVVPVQHWTPPPPPLPPRYVETSHVLHLVLTILTMGFWAIVWIVMVIANGSTNQQRRSDYEQQYAVWQHACWTAQYGGSGW